MTFATLSNISFGLNFGSFTTAISVFLRTTIKAHPTLMMIKRLLSQNLQKVLFKNKAIILLGARQTGKTTLLTQLFSNKENVLWLNGDDADVRNLFAHATSTSLRATIGGYATVIIDEAQRIENVGLKLKLITDQIPNIQLVATQMSYGVDKMQVISPDYVEEFLL